MAVNTAHKPTNRRPSTRKQGPAADYYLQSKSVPDYKEVIILRRFINDRGKIVGKDFSGLTSKNQRKVSTEIKKARYMALLPYTDKHAL
jgi:small subunit ribosomal protein S18